MRTCAACVLLTALAFPMAANCGSDASTMAAHDDAKSDSKVVNHAKAEAAASAAVSNSNSNSNSKSGLKMEQAEAKAVKSKHKVKVRKAAALERDVEHDQSLCDLTPHPSWCDQ